MNSTPSADNADNIATKSGVNPFSLLGKPGVLGRGADAQNSRGWREGPHPGIAIVRLAGHLHHSQFRVSHALSLSLRAHPARAERADDSVRFEPGAESERQFFDPWFQFWISVIGARGVSSATVLMRNRPSRDTSY